MTFNVDKYMAEKAARLDPKMARNLIEGDGGERARAIAERMAENPYARTAIATGIEMSPIMMGFLGGHAPAGFAGEVKGVNNPGPGAVADASEAFAARGAQPPSTETKIAQMNNQTGEVRDAMKELLYRAQEDATAKKYSQPNTSIGGRAYVDEHGNIEQKSAYDNPRNAPPNGAEEMAMDDAKEMDKRFAEDQRKVDEGPKTYLRPGKSDGNILYPSDEFKGPGKQRPEITSEGPWNDPNDHRFSDNAKEMLDRISARYSAGEHDEAIMSAQGVNDSSPYIQNGKTRKMLNSSLPNFATKPSGQIGTPGISEPFPTSKGSNQEAFPWMDDKYRAAKELLLKHQSMGMPAEIHTSSDLIAKPDYIEKIPKGSTVNIHHLSDNDHINRNAFPGNPSNKRLVSAAEKLRAAGINVNEIRPTIEEYVSSAGGMKSISQRLGIGNNAEGLAHLKETTGLLSNAEKAAKPSLVEPFNPDKYLSEKTPPEGD